MRYALDFSVDFHALFSITVVFSCSHERHATSTHSTDFAVRSDRRRPDPVCGGTFARRFDGVAAFVRLEHRVRRRSGCDSCSDLDAVPDGQPDGIDPFGQLSSRRLSGKFGKTPKRHSGRRTVDNPSGRTRSDPARRLFAARRRLFALRGPTPSSCVVPPPKLIRPPCSRFCK